MTGIDVRDYWEKRLGADWSLRGVGFSRLGARFNEWQYQQRSDRFHATVRELPIDVHSARVLDVGSGTGFYIDAWARLGAKDVTGLDLTDAAVESLRRTFPAIKFVQADVTETTGDLTLESFDVVSCMDVMFHIVDNRRFAAALSNISSLLVPGGSFIWSDFFVHGTESVEGHITWRSLYRVEATLDQAGFDVVSRMPLFYLMNEPRDARFRLAVPAWKAAMWLASRSETSGDRMGRALYKLDRKLTTRRTESPSTEVMVCRKRSR